MTVTQADYEKAKKMAAASRAKDQTTQEELATKKKAANAVKKLTSEIKSEQDQLKYNAITISELEQKLSDAKTTYVNYVNAHPNPTHDEQQAINSLDNLVNGWEKTLDPYYALRTKLTNSIATQTAERTRQQQIAATGSAKPVVTTNTVKKVAKVTKKKSSSAASTISSSNNSKKTTTFSTDYKYNAPMISSSYFTLDSLQAKELQANGFYVDPGNYSDARNAWSGQGGRGTIQMDKYFLANYDTSQNAKDTVGQFDPQMYGFKFLYNPTTVGMAWGSMASMSPDFEAAGQDKFNPIMAGLASSTIAFSLLLNRIEDMNVLGPTGFADVTNTADQLFANYDAAMQMAQTLKKDVTVNGPYGAFVENNDLAEIYKRGTMYDIEYLFKTINGPNAVFLSSLNGKSADKGWIRPQVVELHLGESLRYRGRITDLSINHAVFDSRMVPVLSTLNLTFARFPDFPIPASGGATH